MKKIIEFSVKHKLIVILFTITILVFGIYGASQLSVGAVPDITNNQVQIITTSTNLSTQDIEQYITMPVELAMANLPGVKEIRSVSKFGLSVVTIIFDEKLGTYLPRQLISEKIIEAQENIPEGMGTPSMGPITTGLGEIYQYTLDVKPEYKDKYSITELRTIQDWIVKRQLSGINGVVEVNTWGGYLKQYEVAINPEELQSHGITLIEVFDALKNNNGITGGSYIEKSNQSYFIRGDGNIKNLGDIRNIVVKNVKGIPILIGDVASVQFGHANRFGAITANGEGEKVMGQVMMLKDANSSQVINDVKNRVNEIQKSLPEGVFINPVIDRSELIGRTTTTIFENLIIGILIVILVVILILGDVRMALVIASIIPLSLFFTFGMMYLFGVDANLMSLGALDFGIIIDGGVIIAEFITLLFSLNSNILNQLQPGVRKIQMDKIAIEGAANMMNSAIFGQLIIIIVFIPILTLIGVEGKMFRPMAATFCFAVIGASIFGMTWLPVASSIFLTPKKNKKSHSSKLMRLAIKTYKPAIEWSWNHKIIIAGASLVLLLLGVIIAPRLGAEFTPTLNEGDFVIQPVLKTGTSLAKTIETTTKMEQVLLTNFKDEVDQIVSRIGAAEVPTDPMSMEEIDMIIRLHPPKKWVHAKSKDELADKFKEALSVFPGMELEFTQPIEMRFNELVTGVRSDIAVKVFGEDLDYLALKAEEISSLISNIPGAADVIVEKTVGLPQMRVTYNRQKIAYYGAAISDLNRYLTMAFGGETAGKIYEAEKGFDLVVRFHENYRQDIENIRQMYVNLPDGKQVRLSELADIEYSAGPAKISRDNTRRRIVVSVNVRNRDLQSVVKDIQNTLNDNLSLQPGYYLEYGGQYENLQNASNRLAVVIPISLALIFLLLVFAFNSIKETLIIFSAIPLAIVGGIVALWVRGMPFSISAGVGFIALFGVAVLNGIVLIEHYKELKENNRNMKIHDLIVNGSMDRLRPVILTASAAALGFLPMAVSTSAGAEVQRPLATVVIGGLITATFLTMIVLPLLYGYFMDDNRKMMFKRKTKVILLPILLLLSTNIQAQNGKPISVDDAVSIGLQNNIGLKTYQLQIEQNRALVPSAFTIGKTGVYYGTDANNRAENEHPLYVVGASQEFNFPTVYAARLNANKIGVSISQAEYNKARFLLVKEINKAYYNILYLLNKQKHYQFISDIYSRSSEMADKQFNAGETTYLEKLNATAKQQQAIIQLEQTISDLNVAYNKLYLLLQTRDSVFVPYRELFPLLVTDTVIANPELQIADQRIKYESSMLNVERNNILPDINFEVFNGTNRFENAKNYWGWQVGVSIPLFFGEQKSKIRARKYGIQMAESMKQAYLLSYSTRQNELRQQLEKYYKNISFYTDSGKKISDEIIRFAEASYNVGEIDFFKYIQNLENATSIKINYLDNLAEYNNIVLELNYLTIE